jgi:hypothetical protein
MIGSSDHRRRIIEVLDLAALDMIELEVLEFFEAGAEQEFR